MSDPVTLAVAAAVAGKLGEGLVEGAKALLPKLRRTLRERLAGSKEDTELLQAVRDDEYDSDAQAKLADRLAVLRERDPVIRDLINELTSTSSRPAVHNSVSGTAGTVTQIGGDVHGDITIGRG
ncbi:hypothetical protein J4H86_10395 [Spiractinospora alimapuensis]|uniref:hypothetical protein n=1 Tax=Spiractinospora alimapuensis TaxID=2820884 RepID=UPI001F39C359|nr:hypothetical protein [Spiractinospora alimapuensis]QVQ54066.1 hypothetical protein J4H86_10395 [Spiractinospora alimapuensis]